MVKIKVHSVYDQKFLGEVELMNETQVMQVLQSSYELFNNRQKWLPPYQRLAILEKAYAIIKEREKDLAITATQEGGKPLTDSLIELARAAEGIKIATKELLHFKGQEVPMGLTPASTHRLAFTMKEPRGVILAISAFNHPFNLIVHQVIPAIAVGCPVIVKPARATPLSCLNLMNILYEAGLPQEWCRMIFCDHAVTEKIVADQRVSFLSFIGSSHVGWRLRSLLAPGAGCALEHGGVAPVIVEKDAPLNSETLQSLLKGSFYHAGQVCVSVQRIFVHQDIMENFAQQFSEAAKRLIVGDPLLEKTQVGPLIHADQGERVHAWVQEAKEKGGIILCGGERITSHLYPPTVILNPPDECLVSQQEIFGPVVCLYSYQNREEAIQRANNVNFAFQAAVFTQGLEVALDTAKKLKASSIMINDHTAFRVDWMPFGGQKESGIGVGGIGHSMQEYSLEKLVVIKSDVL